MSEYVIMQLSDGLGNQMFQYAAATAAANALGGKIVLLAASNPHSKTDYRPILFLKGGQNGPLKPSVVYRQKDSFEAWTPDRFVGIDALSLLGHFQYLPAIAPILPFVKEEFLEALEPIRRQLKHKYNLTMPKRAAFIHVRRGDYLKQPTAHWVQDQQYYEQALNSLPSKPMHWYVLSDDVQWCRAQPWLQDKQIVDEPELISLALMSLCEGAAIISNSTFSWWGAMLSGAHTIYPTKWFKDVKPDIFPSRWAPVSQG